MDSEELRKYLDIINKNSEEVLTEGMLQKLAGLALGTVLALGPQVGEAGTVFSYMPKDGVTMKMTRSQDRIPADAKVVFSIDTVTDEVTIVKGGVKNQEIKPDPAAVQQGKQGQTQVISVQEPQTQKPQAQPAGEKLVGSIESGLSPEQIVSNNNGFTIVKPKFTNLGPIGRISNNFGFSKNIIKAKGESTSPYGTKSDTFVTFDKNNKSNGVAYQIKISQLPEDWRDKGLLGYNRGQVENLVKEIIKNAPSELGGRSGNIKFRDSEGRVIGGTTIGFGTGTATAGGVLGIGSSLNLFSTKLSNFVITQEFENGKIVIPFLVTDDTYYQPEGNNMYMYIQDPNTPKDDLKFEPEFKNK